jgi:hypothetical protein
MAKGKQYGTVEKTMKDKVADKSLKVKGTGKSPMMSMKGMKKGKGC